MSWLWLVIIRISVSCANMHWNDGHVFWRMLPVIITFPALTVQQILWAHSSPCGSFWGQCGTGTGFCPSTSAPPLSTYGGAFSPLAVGYRVTRVFGSGWIEYFGGQGFYWVLCNLGKVYQWFQYYNLKVFLVFLLCVLLFCSSCTLLE